MLCTFDDIRNKEIINIKTALNSLSKKDIIKSCLSVSIILLAILMAVIYIIKYQVEGEKDIPFKLSEITVVSTAEGIENKDTEERWNLSIFQNNDIYFSIVKNENINKENIIKSIDIENIQVIKTPKVGEIKAYMPNSSEGRLFTNSEDTEVKDNKITFKGSTKTNNKMLEIGNQGGTAILRFSNVGIGDYVSNDDEEIIHDGTMITKTDAKLDDIK